MTSFWMRVLGPALVVALGMTGPASAQVGGPGGGDGVEVLRNGPGTFAVSLPDGTCCDGDQIREVRIEDLTIDVREMTTGLDVEYRLYAPGSAHYGNAHFAVEPGSPAGRELEFWFQEAASGKNIRKNITVTLYKTDKTPGRGYNLFDCFPISYSLGDPAAGTDDVLVVEVRGVELTAASDGDRAVLADGDRGLYAIVREPGAPAMVTALWRNWRGGEVAIYPPGQLADARSHLTTPGHKSVGEVTLRGAMTDGRKAMCDWINAGTVGHRPRRNLTIVEIVKGGKGKSYEYSDGFPVRYTFPRISTDPSVPLVEEVSIKPIRFDR